MNCITVKEVEIARLTLTLYSSVQTQPMIHCNMPLEPHRNCEFKTGADFKSSSVFWPYLMHFFPAPVLNSELQCGSNGKLQWIIG